MIDGALRNLIERAAAHLRRRGEPGATAQAPLAANTDWDDSAAPIPPSRPESLQPDPCVIAAETTAAPPEATVHGRQVTIDRHALRQHGIALPADGRSRVAEEFRIVKREVVAKFLDEAESDPEGQKNRVIMVTSAKPGEGKSFAAINLALSIASEQDLKVLLIDLDSRQHAMQEMLGFHTHRGLTDLLANTDVDFADVVLRTNMPNLAVMPAGHPDDRGPELLSSKRARVMFDEMTRRYSDRFIIFDAPACLASSVPATLAGIVGQVVFVVEADQTQQEEVESAILLIRACQNVSLLLNKVRAAATDRFGSYSND